MIRAGMRRSTGNHWISRITNGGFGRSRARERRRQQVVLHDHLHALDDLRRKGAARLHCGEMRRSYRSCAQRLGQDVGGGDRVLHREIDADAADRRHRVRGIADAEQARPVPLPQPVDRHGQQLDVIEALQLADAVAAGTADSASTRSRNAARPSRFTVSMPPFGIT